MFFSSFETAKEKSSWSWSLAMEKGCDICSQDSILFLQWSPAGSNTGLSLPTNVEHIYPVHSISRGKTQESSINELQTGPLQRANEYSQVRLCSGGLFSRVSTVCLMAEQPFPHPAPTESLPTARTLASICALTRGKGQLFRAGICLNKNMVTLENTKWVVWDPVALM